jgi:hypothetical protein
MTYTNLGKVLYIPHQNGIALLVIKPNVKFDKNIKPISNRVILFQVSCQPTNVNIIEVNVQCYVTAIQYNT